MLAWRTLLKGAAGRSAFLGRHWPLLLALGIAAGQQQLRSSSVTRFSPLALLQAPRQQLQN